MRALARRLASAFVAGIEQRSSIMSLLHTAVAFILALGPLIVLHEFGHYSSRAAAG